MSELWHITLLGELRLQRGEQIIRRFRYQKAAGLLAYLACHLRQAHPREVLVDLFWQDSEPEAGRACLSTALSSLRNQLEPPGTPSNSVLRADRFSVGLNPATVTTDVQEFEGAVQRTSDSLILREKIQSLSRCVELYQGQLLPGFYEEWIAPEQERLAGIFFDNVTTLIGLLEESGDLQTALRYARRAVSADPLREETHDRLMRLLAAVGQPGAALRQYRELERLLEEAVGAEPSAPLRALARQVEKQSGLSAPPLPPAAVLPPGPSSGATTGMPTAIPTTVNMLMTDIEAPVWLSERSEDAFTRAMSLHQRLLRQEFARHSGHEIREVGSFFVVVFPNPRRALDCAVKIQQLLSEQEWPQETGPLRVRIALHTGDVRFQEGEYHGVAVNRASRILTAARGSQILVSAATVVLLGRDVDDEVRLADLGIWRLRDDPSPERLYQVEYPGMPANGFGALPADAGYQSNLPGSFNRFFGREQELARLTEMLIPRLADTGMPGEGGQSEPHSRPIHRLITLTGPGGTGKSRLALEVAERLQEAYRGAVWFVPLADLADAGLIPVAVLQALRLPASQQYPQEQVVHALSLQRSLLVLDSFEHLVEGGALTVQSILERVPTLSCLVTSRRLLGLSAEREFPVPALETPNGSHTPERLSLFDSVRLFVDRAQAVMPDFQVTTHNAPAIAEICDRLEGIPLAIELAAARAQVLTPSQMLTQLSDRFAFLVARRRDVSGRHRTLKAAVEWSYRLLAPDLQRFFAHLSVFRGWWTSDAADQVCEEPLALDYLAQLRECSLVLSEETALGMRFRMLDTIREYGHGQLSSEEHIVLSRKHLDYYVQFAQASCSGGYYGGKMGEHYEILEADWDNFRTALSWSRLAERDAEKGLLLALMLKSFGDIRGHAKEIREALERGLVLAPTAPLHMRQGALRCLAYILKRMGEGKQSRVYAEDSLLLARQSGNAVSVAEQLVELGRIDEALAIFQEQNIDWGVTWSQDHKHYAAISRGEYDSARNWFLDRLEAARNEGHLGHQRSHLYRLGHIELCQAKYDRAKDYYLECLSLSRTIKNLAFVGYCHRNIGLVELAQGEYALARVQLEESLTLMRKLGDDLHTALSLCALGEVALGEGRVETARMLSEESLALCEGNGQSNESGVAMALDNLGALALRRGDRADAGAYYMRSLRLKNLEVGDVWHIAAGLENLARVLALESDLLRAAKVFGAATALRERIGAPRRPIDRADLEALVAGLRDSLPAEGFRSAWEVGRAMTLEQAVAFALAEKQD